MIRRLRRRHRVAVPVVAAVALGVGAAALVGRPAPAPPVAELPRAAPARQVSVPDVAAAGAVAVYWTADVDPVVPGPDAVLLGALPEGATVVDVPAELADRGAVTLWELERTRVAAVVPLGAEGAAWR